MKKLIMLGGAMGTGKTAVSELLVNSLKNSVMLDGDWCWQQGCDWHFDEESKAMSMDNIRYLLRSFLRNSHFENVIFCWVLHLQSIHDDIINYLRDNGCEFELYDISLMVNEPALRGRLSERARRKALERGLPFDPTALDEITARAMERMGHYNELNTIKLDTSSISPMEVAKKVREIAGID